jgi:outer membrane protein
MRLLTFVFILLSVLVQAQTKPADAVASGKIGYLDVENLVAQLPEYKQLQTKMQETRKSMSDRLFEKQQNFQRVYSDYMQNGESMADTTRARVEGQLRQLDNEMQQFRAEAENTFENTKKLFLAPVYLRLGGVIQQVAAENGFIMILPYRVGNADMILQADPKLDISELVLKKMTAAK